MTVAAKLVSKRTGKIFIEIDVAGIRLEWCGRPDLTLATGFYISYAFTGLFLLLP